jgi:catechol 2,3-dioxygenase-like lactoylglutathione lyase family enzyme
MITAIGETSPLENWDKLVPEFLVRDLEASLHFWRDLLGFAVAYDRPEEGFAYLDLDGAQVMLERRNPAARQWLTGDLDLPLGRGINFQIEVPSVDAILGRLEAAAWPLFMACETKWYRAGAVESGQRQFLVQDPDGYLIRLTEVLGERPIGGREWPGSRDRLGCC